MLPENATVEQVSNVLADTDAPGSAATRRWLMSNAVGLAALAVSVPGAIKDAVDLLDQETPLAATTEEVRLLTEQLRLLREELKNQRRAPRQR